MMLLGSEIVLSSPTAAKTQCSFHLKFNSSLQLINGISSNLQKLLRQFNVTTVAAFLRIPSLLFAAG